MAGAVRAAALVLAGRPDTFEAAATLAGTVGGPVLGVFAVWPSPQDHYRQHLAHVGAALGMDRYTNAQQQGAAMTYNQIFAYALDQLGRFADP